MVNIQNVPENPDTTIPEGKYRVIVIAAIEKASKKGDPMWELTLKVVSPTEVAGKQTVDFELMDWIVFSADPKMIRMWKKKARAYGFTVEDNRPFTASPDQAVGRMVCATVVSEDYNEERQSKIKFVDRDQGDVAAPTVFDPNDIRF